MSPKMPMSKFQQQETTAKKSTKKPVGEPTTPAPVQNPDEMIEAMIDQQITDNAATEARIEADEQDYAEVTEAAALAETPAPVAELTYTPDDSQVPPDDPRIEPTFEPVAPPPDPVKKGKKSKALADNGSATGTIKAWADMTQAERDAELEKAHNAGVESLKHVKQAQAEKKAAAKAAKNANHVPAEPPPVKKGKASKATAAPATVERVGSSNNLPDVISNVGKALFDSRQFGITALGLRIEGDPTFEDWSSFGATMDIARRGLDWSGYDWARYGEEHYGESYVQWAEKTGLSDQTLYNRMNTLKRYTIDQRVYGVSISAHVEAASLDPVLRNGLLLEMQAGKIKNITELRARIQEIKKGVDEAAGAGDDKGSKGEGDDAGDDEEKVDTRTWVEAGTFEFIHVGDAIFEPMTDDAGELPAALKALLKSRTLNGSVRLTIMVAK